MLLSIPRPTQLSIVLRLITKQKKLTPLVCPGMGSPLAKRCMSRFVLNDTLGLAEAVPLEVSVTFSVGALVVDGSFVGCVVG